METIQLINPTLAYADDILAFRSEVEAADDADSFAGCSSLQKCVSAEEWLELLAKRKNPATLPKGSVSSDAYLAVRRTDNRIVGMIDLRHHIDHPILGLWGGHMGYTVRPSERGKGYAIEMLRLNLENCRLRGMDKVLLTCSRGNPASEQTILANGGVFEKEICVDGEYIKRYWITLKKSYR